MCDARVVRLGGAEELDEELDEALDEALDEELDEELEEHEFGQHSGIKHAQ